MTSGSGRNNPHDATACRSFPERRYRKPPVIEALCEVYFADSAWDGTVPGVFYERIKMDYPRKQQKRIQQAQIAVGPDQAMAGVRQLPSWMQFVSDEKHRMIQLAENLVVVNQLAPYTHFEDWEPEIYRAFELYREVAHPKSVVRLGMRYINRVVIPAETFRMEEYFTIYPALPKVLGNTYRSFLVQVDSHREGQNHVILITFGTAPPPEQTQLAHAFVLDFYDILEDQCLDAERFRKEVERAHENIVAVFEASITDRLRCLFEEEPIQ
ncbi:MAG: TIGR04255 family protein [Pirellulaceae bacterium]|nr:MAG: TIGR04255 family protein [Pirellulaceae bacterium]